MRFNMSALVLIFFVFYYSQPVVYGQLEKLQSCLLTSSVNPKNVFLKNNMDLKSSNSLMNYETLNYQWQLHGGLIQPTGYLVPTKVEEIQAAVRCAKVANISVVPKCGGHSYGKYSFGNSNTLVIDLQKLDEVIVDPNNTYKATVGAGSLTGHMGWKLWSVSKKILPIGICPTVGIGGLALGGGHGYLARTYGLMMDNVIEMEMVDSKGELLIANPEINSELFWALKGAGGGSFGIVSKFTFKVHDAPNEVAYLINYYTLDKFPEVFDSWQKFVSNNSWNIISTALHVKGGLVHVEFVTFQTTESNLKSEFVLKLFSDSFPPTDSRSIDFLTYPKFVLKMAHRFGMITYPPIVEASDLINITRHSFGTSYMRAKSFYARNLVDMHGLKEMGKVVNRLPPKAVLYFLSYGGVINDISPEESSFIHRNEVLYHCEMVQYGTYQDDQDGFLWINEFFEVSQKVMRHNESYQNYIDDQLKNYLVRYYGHNLKALVEIKNKYDPDNFFNNPMSIPTTYPENMTFIEEEEEENELGSVMVGNGGGLSHFTGQNGCIKQKICSFVTTVFSLLLILIVS